MTSEALSSVKSYLTTLYRSYNGVVHDHLYTADSGEWDRAVGIGWGKEESPGYVFAKSVPESVKSTHRLVPLYRLYNGINTDHFYTIDSDERTRAMSTLGYGDEGIVGYVLPDGDHKFGSDVVPLYRLWNPLGDHFYTSDSKERDNATSLLGYTKEDNAGYIFSPDLTI